MRGQQTTFQHQPHQGLYLCQSQVGKTWLLAHSQTLLSVDANKKLHAPIKQTIHLESTYEMLNMRRCMQAAKHPKL